VLQGFLMIVLGASAIVASVASGAYSGFTALTYIGVMVWLIGYFFEVVGDKQLDDFIKNRQSDKKILDTGLWRYTRHPNYFGEVTMWWGIWLMVAELPLSYLALVSPVAITYLILFVSGVPMLERKYADDPNYGAYKARTSRFIPLPPKQ
jgi:steroid 5-alpha reductase family enzyme